MIWLYKINAKLMDSSYEGTIARMMRKRATEILHNGRDIAYIETAHGEFLDVNFLTDKADIYGQGIKDNRYWKFVKEIYQYIDKKYKTHLMSGQPHGFTDKYSLIKEHIKNGRAK